MGQTNPEGSKGKNWSIEFAAVQQHLNVSNHVERKCELAKDGYSLMTMLLQAVTVLLNTKAEGMWLGVVCVRQTATPSYLIQYRGT